MLPYKRQKLVRLGFMSKNRTIIFGLIIILSIVFQSSVVTADNTNTLQNVVHVQTGDIDQVIIYLSKPQDYNYMTLNNPYRVVIDFPDTTWKGKTKSVTVNNSNINELRYAQFTPTTARVVLDLKDNKNFDIQKNGRFVFVNVYDSSKNVTPKPKDDSKNDNNDDVKDEGKYNTDDKGKDEDINDIERPGKEDDNLIDRGDGVRTTIDITHKSLGVKDNVQINLPNYTKYNIMRLTNPERLVIDFKGTDISAKLKTENVNSKFIKSIRYSQFDKNTTRVVLDLKDQFDYLQTDVNGRFSIFIQEPTHKNIKYSRSGDRYFLSIKGLQLTGGKDSLDRYYVPRFNSSRDTFSIEFPTEKADLGRGTLKINDNYLDSIKIDKITSTGKTRVTFIAKEVLDYNVFGRPEVKDSAITIIKPASKKDKLVVIDPGHGGAETGASYGGSKEKDLNLDIAVRLNKLLEAKGINTYLLRDDDSFIGVIERAYIANKINATLFLSIHNNAGFSTANGTEVLCYGGPTSGFSGHRFAQLLQNKLVSKLGTYNRGVNLRPGLGVLRTTSMPSALAEIAFLSNESDLNKLKSASFRQKAAEAMCEAILQALNEVK